MGDEGWEARMSARAAERGRQLAEQQRAEREEQERRWAALTHDEIPAEYRRHHHHSLPSGDQCSCGRLVSVCCHLPPGEDTEPWECAACGERWATYAGPPRHEEGEVGSPLSLSGSWVDGEGRERPVEWQDGSTWAEPADGWSYPVVDPDTGRPGQHVEPGVYRPELNSDGTVSLFRPEWVDDIRPRWDPDRHRRLWVGEWKDPVPPTAGHAATHDLERFPVPEARREEWSARWVCKQCRRQAYITYADGPDGPWGRAADEPCTGKQPEPGRRELPLLQPPGTWP